jgi:CRP-like cAMP-binding protein
MQVEVPGPAIRIPVTSFVHAMERAPAFRNVMYGYVQAFVQQLVLSAACQAGHSLIQRLARSLLTIRDTHDGDDLPVSQQQLAVMLGVHRPSITNAAEELEALGLIKRGVRQLTVRDRYALADVACECYHLMRARRTGRHRSHAASLK